MRLNLFNSYNYIYSYNNFTIILIILNNQFIHNPEVLADKYPDPQKFDILNCK